MKNTAFLSLLSVLLFACSPKSDVPADLLFDCMNSTFRENGFELADELKSLEQDLVLKGVLENGEPASIYRAFEQLANSELPAFTLHPEEHPALFQLQPHELYSAACWDSLTLLEKDHGESKVYALQKGMNELSAQGVLQPSEIAKKELSILDVNDLNHCYYSFSLLMQLVYVADIETAIGIPEQD